MFLEEIGIPQDQINQICRVINAVSFSKNRGKHPETIESRCPGCRPLDAIGAVGIARTFSYGGHKERPLTDTIQHFHDKLLLLKDEMNTETAKQMAESRHQFLITF